VKDKKDGKEKNIKIKMSSERKILFWMEIASCEK
jgi:hypothetical protein